MANLVDTPFNSINDDDFLDLFRPPLVEGESNTNPRITSFENHVTDKYLIHRHKS